MTNKKTAQHTNAKQKIDLSFIKSPMTYPEIAEKVKHGFSPFDLSLALSRAVLSGNLQYRQPAKGFFSTWPFYGEGKRTPVQRSKAKRSLTMHAHIVTIRMRRDENP